VVAVPRTHHYDVSVTWTGNRGTGDYTDDAHGTMVESAEGGHFTEVVLRPRVTVMSPDMIEKATSLHQTAHERCFIANSVNFPVRHEPVVVAAESPSPSA
jgi:organic hydroperoxide reductase OsmC/OhrA